MGSTLSTLSTLFFLLRKPLLLNHPQPALSWRPPLPSLLSLNRSLLQSRLSRWDLWLSPRIQVRPAGTGLGSTEIAQPVEKSSALEP